MYSLKIVIRRLLKDKAFTCFNILGLVVGISSFLVLFIHVSNEKSFDKHFAEHDNIYRVHSTPGGQSNGNWARGLGIIHEAASKIPEVKQATQFSSCDVGTIKIGDNLLQQNNIMAVDEAFCDMFEVEAFVGNLSELKKPNTVFVSENFAKLHYGNLNPIGQIIKVEALQYIRNLGEYEIRGIVKNTHPKTHFKYELLLSQKGSLQERFESLADRKIQWTYNYYNLESGAKPKLVAEKIKDFWDKSSVKSTRGPKEYSFALFPLDDIHLKSSSRFELRESSSKINISLFVVVTFVILLISLLNFTNLTVAKLIKRSKELGLRKSIGANQYQIIAQLLSEVLIFCVLAIGVSLLFIQVSKSIINSLFDIEFEIFYNEPIIYLSILTVVGTCLVMTALFIAVFLLGRNSTMDILAERNNFSGSSILKTLLVGQVTIVIILISGTLLVNRQISFVLNQPLGYDKENVVVLHLKDLSKDPAVFVNELKKQSQIASVGMSAHHLGYPAQGLPLDGMRLEGTAEFVFANYDYLKTMNIKMVENWIKQEADTVRGLVVNEHLYKRLIEEHGSKEALITYQAAQPVPSDMQRIDLVGVVGDFNYSSAHEAIGDFAFLLGESRTRARFTHVRINNLHSGMDAIKKVWSEHYPNQSMNYFFVDEKITQQYKSENILSRILFVFSAIGILICIIGVSALALFISQQRTKEIGIRKVNGAKISEILAMLNKDFVKWVVLAFIIACPIAYYAMNKWLENFAYKTTLSWWIFVLAGILALAIALLTVSWQSWRAATRNPVEALRYE